MTCPQCGREQEHAASLAGLRVRCKGCDGWLQLPSRSTGIAPPRPAFSSGGPAHGDAVVQAPAALALVAEPSVAESEAEIFCPRCCVVNVVRKQPGPQAVVC